MRAKKSKQEEGILEVEVTDNDGNIHLIGINEGDGVEYHDSDHYASNPSSRTKEENERIAQARRFAKYWVFCEYGRGTVEKRNNPMYIDSVRKVITRMDITEFAVTFDEMYKQQEYELGDVTEKVIDVPDDVDEYVYGQDFEVQGSELDRERMQRELFEEHSLDVTKNVKTGDVLPDEIEDWNNIITEPKNVDSDLEHDFAVEEINNSDLLLMVSDEYELVKYDESSGFDEPHATVELAHFDTRSMSGFKAEVEHHMLCQIRDLLVQMGVIPSSEFHVLGHGKYMASKAYRSVDFYSELHVADREEDDEEDGIVNKFKSMFDS